MKICASCNSRYNDAQLYCALDGLALTTVPEVAQVPAVATGATAQIVMWAKPKMSIGALNTLDAANAVMVDLNGTVHEMSWGRRTFSVPSGTCRVGVSITNPIYGSNRSAAELTVNLKAGETLPLRYTGGFTIFQEGKLEVDPDAVHMPQAMPVASASPTTKACISCHGGMPMRAQFCPHCGKAQEHKVGVSCTVCHAVQATGRFCGRCGGAMA